ncbi:MAG: putative baseplate assembly protein, partial [Verrucomicrobiota bacterium]|nr:putative baseplate assembly protein [Verrucomicrobiota bacterium]
PGETGAVPPAGAALAKENFRIDGGVRITGIEITDLKVKKNVATITVNARGDFSTYTLSLVSSLTDTDSPPPTGFDPALASIDFNFKAACPSDFDCEQKQICPPPVLNEPALNYLAKDYATFRRLLLDRVSSLLPGWTDAHEADIGITLVELLAYAADELSYRQDAIATEAYLGTARSRISLRRHARLLDYRLHDGCNARAFVCVAVKKATAADGATLPAGTLLLTRGSDSRITLPPSDLDAAVRENPTVFAALHDLDLSSAQNEIEFHTWSDAQCCLPRGATRATLKDDPATGLAVGDLLIFEEIVGATTGLPADADPTHRHVVRLTQADSTTDPLDGTPLLEISWAVADALPFPLCISVKLIDATDPTTVAVVRGNIVLADHGYQGAPETLVLDDLAANRAPRGALARAGVTFAAPFDAEEARSRPASAAVATSPRDALSEVTLDLDGDTWLPQRELLESDRFAQEFVVEVERDGIAHVRFGDDVLGLRPPDGAQFTATYRTGNGTAGNVGAESLVRVVANFPSGSILSVRNPLSAVGGVDPESMEQVRQFAPQAFRIQERAVTAADWVEVAERHSEVQRAAAEFRWTGSWYTAFVTIDRLGGRAVTGDELFLSDMRRFLDQFRIAGYDLEINGPIFVPLDIALTICVAPRYFRGDVEEALLDALSARDLPGGRRGFFHPDNFTFGQPVYLSQLVAAAMNVTGVASVVVTTFQRYGKKANGELAAGVLSTAALEIARCDNDPNFPENGRLKLDLQGGL